MLKLDKLLDKNHIELEDVIQIGLEESSPFEDAFIYDAHGVSRVVYFDSLPQKILYTRKHLLDRRWQEANLAVITSKNRQPVKIFTENLWFILEGKSLDLAIVENKIHPLDITLLNINVDGRIDDILKSAEMLFKIGLKYVIIKNLEYHDIICGYGFSQIDEGLYKNGCRFVQSK